PGSLADLLKQVESSGINKQRARQVYQRMLDSGASADQAIESLGLKVVGDESQLLELIRTAIAANPKAVTDFKKGKLKAIDAIKGAVMRETRGMAKIETVQRLLMDEIQRS